MWKIVIDKDKCIGCGACTSVSENFEMGKDEKSKPKKLTLDNPGDSKDAADLCPVGAIKIVEEK